MTPRSPETGARPRIGALAGAGLAALVACLPASAADGVLGEFKAWTATRFTDKGKSACMIWSEPEASAGKYKRRGEIFVFVTHRPQEKDFDKVSFEIGYAFKADSKVTVKIDKKTFELAAAGSMAWSRNPKDDTRLVRAMRGGRKMIVDGVSSRGTRTTDTFSLLGFTAAHKAIDKACKRR